MLIAAIAAMSVNRVIGKNNQLPWHLPADLQHFKKITFGKPVLMGRKTFESIGRPLPGRQNIVITRNSEWTAPGCHVVNSVEAALLAAGECDEVFVIGGAMLYQQMLPQIQRLYLTVVEEDFEGDAFFPELNWDEWREVECERHVKDEKNQFAYRFLRLEKS
jgi:dihydrofolate reductase